MGGKRPVLLTSLLYDESSSERPKADCRDVSNQNLLCPNKNSLLFHTRATRSQKMRMNWASVHEKATRHHWILMTIL